VSDDVAPSARVSGRLWPSVSVVMPVRDEAAHLAQAVAAITDQHYPGELDVWLAVAPSADGTEALAVRLAGSD